MGSMHWHLRYLQAISSEGLPESIAESAAAPPELRAAAPEFYTAKTLARRRSLGVRCSEDFIARISGLRNLTTRVFRGDRGKIIGDNGNFRTLMLANAGRVVVSDEEFERFFAPLSDQTLAFTDPEPGEMMG